MRRSLGLLALTLLLSLPATADDVTRVVLGNGMRVIARPDPGTDIVAVDLLMDVSAADEEPGETGIRYLVQRLLLRGTENESGDEMAERLASIGGMADVSVGLDYVELYVLVPAGGFEQALGMVADMVHNPAFLPQEVERQREAAVEVARSTGTDPFQASYLAMREKLYPGHPYSRSTFGEAADLSRLTRGQLVSFHQRHYQPGRAVLAISGGAAAGRAVRRAETVFADWAGPPAILRVREDAPPLAFSEVVARELPGDRAHLLIGFRAPRAGEAGYFAVQVIDALLSGRSSARLPSRLRDQLGLVYDVLSFCPTLAGPGHFSVYVVTDPDKVEEARSAIVEVLGDLASRPVGAEELARAKRYLLGTYALGHERQKDQAYSLAWYEVLGLGVDFGERYREGVEGVTAAQVQETARSAFERPVVAVAMPAE